MVIFYEFFNIYFSDPDYYFSTFLFDSPIYLILIFGIFLIFILVLLNYKTIFSTNKSGNFYYLIFLISICSTFNKSSKFSEIIYPYPKILLIYKSTDNLHNRLVESFAKLLKNDYSINVILDIFDIPSSPQKVSYSFSLLSCLLKFFIINSFFLLGSIFMV